MGGVTIWSEMDGARQSFAAPVRALAARLMSLVAVPLELTVQRWGRSASLGMAVSALEAQRYGAVIVNTVPRLRARGLI